MAYKPLWDWMDKHEGRKEGSSHEAMEKEKAHQYPKDTKKKIAKKMKKLPHMDITREEWNKRFEKVQKKEGFMK